MSANPLLSIEGLTASVDEKTILHNVNLNVAAGETHVLMGPTAPASPPSATWSWATPFTRSTTAASSLTARTSPSSPPTSARAPACS